MLKNELVEQLDTTKLHNEINQIKNQRFLLTTSAITVYGIVSGWLNSKVDVHSYTLVTFLSTLLYIILFLFFIYNNDLKETLMIISSYLVATKNSKWEKNYALFQEKRIKSMKKIASSLAIVQSTVYFILGAAIFFYPFIFTTNYFQQKDFFYLHAFFSFCYFFLLIAVYRRTKKNYSKNVLIARWNKILKTSYGEDVLP